MRVTVNTHESGQSPEPVLSCPEGATPAPANGHYAAVRYNALKHGILSRLAVLAHEDHAGFDGLLAALVEEHRPAGITEHTLIEALATLIWRKRRVLLAEGEDQPRVEAFCTSC